MDDTLGIYSAAEAESRRLQGLDGPLRWLASREHDHLVDVARNLFHCPSATITLEELAPPDCDDASFGRHVATSVGPLVVEDTLKDPRFADNVMVRAYPHVRFYLGTAIHLANGRPIGTLAVLDYIARARPRNCELAALESLASLAGSYVEKTLFDDAHPAQAAHFETLVARARTSVLTIDIEGRIAAANRAAQRLLRSPLSGLVGRPADDHVIGWRVLLGDAAARTPEGPLRTMLVEVITADFGIVPALASLSTWLIDSVPVYRLLVDELP